MINYVIDNMKSDVTLSSKGLVGTGLIHISATFFPFKPNLQIQRCYKYSISYISCKKIQIKTWRDNICVFFFNK